eukprot:3976477-Pleurochrysis_carterae.AAC.2
MALGKLREAACTQVLQNGWIAQAGVAGKTRANMLLHVPFERIKERYLASRGRGTCPCRKQRSEKMTHIHVYALARLCPRSPGFVRMQVRRQAGAGLRSHHCWRHHSGATYALPRPSEGVVIAYNPLRNTYSYTHTSRDQY